MEYSAQNPQQPSRPAAVPPGWYADPFAVAGERYWDGIAWSREFTRAGPPAPEQKYAEQIAAATSAPTAHAGGMPPGVMPMVLGAILIIWRVIYIANATAPAGASAAYEQGRMVGSVVGAIFSAAIFSYGFYRYRSAKESPTGQPAPDSFQQGLPMAIAIAVSCVVIASLIN